MITPLHVPFLTSLLGSVYNIYAYKMVLIQVNVANTDGKYVRKIECLFAKISRTCSMNNPTYLKIDQTCKNYKLQNFVALTI